MRCLAIPVLHIIIIMLNAVFQAVRLAPLLPYCFVCLLFLFVPFRGRFAGWTIMTYTYACEMPGAGPQIGFACTSAGVQTIH